MRKLARVAVAAAIVSAVGLTPAAPTAAFASAASSAAGTPIASSSAVTLAAPRSDNCVGPGIQEDEVPWAQRALGPERVWPFTRGQGVVVAVLDSGVDAQHPQLRGRVLDGYDVLAGGGPANTDCHGTGTRVAGVIAARPASGTGFAGFAPDARILPIRVVQRATNEGLIADPAALATGIDVALSMDADVIAVSAITYRNDDRLEAAVERAVRAGVTVVAAVGDRGDGSGGNPTPYPAAYSGVIGVGAIDETGTRWSRSQRGRYVDLVAPGAGVLTLQANSTMTLADGTGVACGFVAATAALVRARPGSGVSASAVDDVLLATATPAATGSHYGRGIVDPYAAVNSILVDGEPAELPAPPAPAEVDNSAWLRARGLAIAGAGIVLLAGVVVIVVAYAIPRGQRRFWRGALARKVPSAAEPDEPGPPIQLFDNQTAVGKNS